jgi:hypothetical protein
MGEYYKPKIDGKEDFLIGKIGETSTTNYKVKLLLSKKNHKNVIIGSSRVLQFRKEFFTDDFINLGFILNSGKSVDEFGTLLNKYNIKIDELVISVDPWWFKKADESLNLKGLQGLKNETFISYFDVIKNFNNINLINFDRIGFCKLYGINARRMLSGFRNDGSLSFGVNYYRNRDTNVFMKKPLDIPISSKLNLESDISDIQVKYFFDGIVKISKRCHKLTIVQLPLPLYFYNSPICLNLDSIFEKECANKNVNYIKFKSHRGSDFIDPLHVNTKYCYNILPVIFKNSKINHDLKFIDENYLLKYDNIMYHHIKKMKFPLR